MPPFSIITPCYNDGRFIGDAVASVERCDASLYELVIVDDGSTDPHTLSVLGGLEGRGHRVIRQENRGLGPARNAGVAAASGEYILPLDCDNKIRPEYLTLALAAFASEPAVGVVHGKAQFFGDKSDVWEIAEFDPAAMWRGNYIDACAAYRRRVWEEVGGYDESMPYPGWEDWDFWLGVAEKGWKFRHLGRVVFDYQVRGDSMIAQYRSRMVPPEIDEYVARKHAAYLKQTYDRLYDHAQAPESHGLTSRIIPAVRRRLHALAGGSRG